jgi:hypothetical protein
MKDAKGHGSNSRGGRAAAMASLEAKGKIPAGTSEAVATMLGSHQTGVAQVGQPPSPNLKSLNTQYNRNESMNNHSGNIALLAKNFGTADEHAKAQEIIKGRQKLGWLPDSTPNVPNVRDWQYGIHQKYINKLKG